MDQPKRSRSVPAVDPADDLRRFHAALAAMPTRQGWRERVLRALIAAFCRLVAWRVRLVFHASLPEREGVPGAGCFIVAAPHRAWVEPFLVLAAWPRDAARLVWLADAQTVTSTRWRRRLLPHLGIIAVSRPAGGPRTYAALAAAACERGLAVAIFPEVGPPSPPDRPRRISPGFAYLALHAGAPVVPVVIAGTHRIVRGSRFSLDVCEAIEVGPAMPEPFTPAARAEARALCLGLEAVVASLLPERTAAVDALAPEPERWRWLGTLLR